jgi:hypothetical protein
MYPLVPKWTVFKTSKVKEGQVTKTLQCKRTNHKLQGHRAPFPVNIDINSYLPRRRMIRGKVQEKEKKNLRSGMSDER